MKVDSVFIYVTVPSKADALRMGRVLVEERLVACVNVTGAIHSIYHWDGAVQQGREVAFIAKTTRRRFSAMARRTRELHPYKCPCIVCLPILDGHPDFLAWIAKETVMPPPPAISRRGGSRPAGRRGTGSKRASART